ncbi:caspase family protein [Yoonia sediminilitoris]|uniref:Putative caspase-like protein n=1 Tax=Yoonia sediminilitoris TaxID=1286148 RepID=A0A2T6KPZ6_9RHOB|nr:caspase family protein [Yoonia sediminilitoris]PUB18618.1 putative caspase-like protein [Yoonia sediminilitoris]RCW98786.1 putative caspase-like protein [Yoonia sediminilitoris]
MIRTLFLIISLAVFLPDLAVAAKRAGLIIGNDNYAHVPMLEKARNDARAVSDTLSGLGFDVTVILDADRREMNRAIATFTGQLQPGDTALVFFAGHGVEIDGENYLLPVDIEAPDTANEDFIKFESIGLSDVLLRVQNTGARTTLMFIDACRDNPFAATAGRNIGGSRGLARVTAPEGTFVVFSAGAQQQALDRLNGPDSDPNSVFTRTLLPRLTQPNLELRELISEVRLEVRDLALKQNHQQFPAYYDELLGKFYFNSDGGEALPATPVVEQVPTADPAGEALRADFARARSLGSVVAYEAFLEKHKDKSDLLIVIAIRELDRLRDDDNPVETEAEEVATPPEIPAVPQKEIIRQSQQRLNALGCAAGQADGVVGPRTRRAFRAFVNESGAKIALSALGTQEALDLLNAADGTVCTQAAVQTRPAPSAPRARSLTGTWSFVSKCPLFVSSVGSTTYRSQGGNNYSVVTRDDLGNVGRGTTTDVGDGTLQVRIVWQNGVRDNYRAVLSSDRRRISGTNVLGCRFTATR